MATTQATAGPSGHRRNKTIDTIASVADPRRSSVIIPTKAELRHLSKAPSRWYLRMQALWWRVLMSWGMFFHRLPSPRPPHPSFSRVVSSTVSPTPGTFKLQFYTPANYTMREPDRRFPVVVNFHGGGFTIGTATDDARFAHRIINDVPAVFVSVEYRLAPEYPFPTAVEDGVDAILYLVDHADELGIDPMNIALTGFSAGGNLAFTVPLKLHDRTLISRHSVDLGAVNSGSQGWDIKAIVAWYPATDCTKTRAQRRAANPRPDKHVPSYLTDLFDFSYLPSVTDQRALSDPYLSPGVAPDAILKHLPADISIYACEWDMLLGEAQRFSHRLRDDAGKNVKFNVIEGVHHAWDKSPNPFSLHPATMGRYKLACEDLKKAFEGVEWVSDIEDFKESV
ncbi:MAG: hypothetical protein M1819_006226 [Sarea resinae]|nr:MAG: hypothetical protein M1819_006226 [Sarea resinae]